MRVCLPAVALVRLSAYLLLTAQYSASHVLVQLALVGCLTARV